MPRPSLKDQRTEEILDAYLTCVARFGLEGATQERIAEQAGLKRPLLRHYLGNRDQMIAALTAHVVQGFAISTDALAEATLEISRPGDLVELLFSRDAPSDPRLMLAWQALTTAAAEHPGMRETLLQSLERFLNVIENALRRVAPQADAALLRAVTQGIASPYINLDAMTTLNPPAQWRDELKHAALILASCLETE